ncbi:unnamed protein product [Closterium sp. NIES-54]
MHAHLQRSSARVHAGEAGGACRALAGGGAAPRAVSNCCHLRPPHCEPSTQRSFPCRLPSLSLPPEQQAAGHMRRAGMVEAALHRMALAACPHDAVVSRLPPSHPFSLTSHALTACNATFHVLALLLAPPAVYAWVRCGEGGRALEVLQEMVAAGHPPAMTVPDVLIKVCPP